MSKPVRHCRIHHATLLVSLLVALDSAPRSTAGVPHQAPAGRARVSDTKFDLGRGIYDGPVTETVTTATPGASIVYTTDGSAPSVGNGIVVHAGSPDAAPRASVAISRSTVLRARAFKPGVEPTNIDTHTYVLVPEVAAQSGDGLPAFAPWGHAGPDWSMDPRITSSAGHAGLAGALRAVPSVAISMDWADLFGVDGRGIYIQGEDVDKAAVVELLVPEGVAGDAFDWDARVEIAGGSSVVRWRSDKLSMRLKFPRDLRADVFTNGRAVKRFDTLVLDAGFNNHWHYGGTTTRTAQRLRTQFVLDQYVADLQRANGGYAPHGRPVFLYLNRLFWGLYILHERPDDDFAAAYLGGNKDDYDVLRHRRSVVVAGTAAAYNELLAAARKDLTVHANYRKVADRLDLDGFIRYILVNFYVGNVDWSAQNWYATFNRISGKGLWRFHSWDAEFVMDTPHRDVTEVRGRDDGGPKYLHSLLRQNESYRARFASIARELLEGSGTLTPASAAALYKTRADEVERAVVAESARWGDNRRPEPYTIEDWRSRRDYLFNEYFPARTAVLQQQLLEDRLFPLAELK